MYLGSLNAAQNLLYFICYTVPKVLKVITLDVDSDWDVGVLFLLLSPFNFPPKTKIGKH